jgi:hypothetical protein
VYSMAKFALSERGSFTLVVLDHTGFPEGEFDHLEWGWNNHYWEPLKKPCLIAHKVLREDVSDLWNTCSHLKQRC